MPFLLPALLLSAVNLANAATRPPVAHEFFQPLSAERPRPSAWPGSLTLKPVTKLSRAQVEQAAQGHWQVLWHCGGTPPRASYLSGLIGRPLAQSTLSYTIEGDQFWRTAAAGPAIENQDQGELKLWMKLDGSFELLFRGKQDGLWQSERFVEVEGSGEWAIEVAPRRGWEQTCENGHVLRGLWVRLDAPAS